MGQKVSPHGLRVGVIKDWDSKWFADKSKFADFLVEDNQIREYVKKKLYAAGVSKVVIERAADNKIKVIVMTAKPGMVIGRSGTGIDDLKAELIPEGNTVYAAAFFGYVDTEPRDRGERKGTISYH